MTACVKEDSDGGASSSHYGGGVRRSHTVNGVAATYTYDVGAGLLVVLQDGTNTLVCGLDLISSTDGAGARTYFSYDGLGSTTDLTDATGAVTDTYSYDVFGAVRARTGTNTSPWKFTGEQEDGTTGDSGYYFLRARYYDPSTGRFPSKDPIEFDQRYAYARGNPARFVDPTGLEDQGSYGTKTGCPLYADCESAVAPRGRLVEPSPTFGGFFDENMFGICVNGTGGAIWGLIRSECFLFNAHGGGRASTIGTGWETATAGIALGPTFVAGARSLSDVAGPFDYAGGQAGTFISGSYDYASGRGARGQLVEQYNVSGGVGLDIPEVHWGKGA